VVALAQQQPVRTTGSLSLSPPLTQIVFGEFVLKEILPIGEFDD
jgi:hypothetical protein